MLQRKQGLTWLVICLQYDYGQMLGSSQAFYRSQWVGNLAGVDAPSWRGDAFTTEVGPSKLSWGDITGGVMEGGNAGMQAFFFSLIFWVVGKLFMTSVTHTRSERNTRAMFSLCVDQQQAH